MPVISQSFLEVAESRDPTCCMRDVPRHKMAATSGDLGNAGKKTDFSTSVFSQYIIIIINMSEMRLFQMLERSFVDTVYGKDYQCV